MIQCLSGAPHKTSDPPTVTQDPLAALPELSSSHADTHIYAITRVNPLYSDDGSAPVEQVAKAGGQDSPRKSVSSGYESRGNSSSDSGSCTECDALPKREKRTKQDRKKREKANDLIDNVLAANYSSIKRRPKNIKGACCANGAPNLTTIPEGKLDVSIPPTIWPRCDSCQQPISHVPVHNGSTDPINFIYKYSEKFPGTSNFRIQFLNELADELPRREYQHSWEECFAIQFEKQNRKVYRIGQSSKGKGGTPDSTVDRGKHSAHHTQVVLQDLASFLTHVMNQKNEVPVEDVLLSVSESVQKSLHLLANPPKVKGEFILCSPHSTKEETYSSSSSSGFKDIYAATSSSSLESLAERLKLFQRVKAESAFSKSNRDTERSKDRSLSPSLSFVHHQRDYSSSSLESASNSYTSHSLPSSSSSAKALKEGQQEELYSVPNSVRNVLMIDGAKSVDYGSSAYDKLISAKRKFSDVNGPLKDPKSDSGTSIIPNMKKGLLKKVEHPYYVAMGRPDFTLDLPQAERMMKKIAASKRQRCWCRLTTSFLGLVFFLASVMLVSMFITRGRKMFGAV